MTISIKSSVGRNGHNKKSDVLVIQRALNQLPEHSGLTFFIPETGVIDTHPEQCPTCLAITRLQREVLKFRHPDQLISTGGSTIRMINQLLDEEMLLNLIRHPPMSVPEKPGIESFSAIAEQLHCEAAAVRAVAEVEASGSGFFASGRPAVLFEAHIFSRLTDHRFDRDYPDISSPRWNRELYQGGEKEYDRLLKAAILDLNAAIESSSWGMYQLMGFNYRLAGYPYAAEFVADMFTSELHQLQAFSHLILSNQRLLAAIQQKDWPQFARHYNGPEYLRHHYDRKLQDAYLSLSEKIRHQKNGLS